MKIFLDTAKISEIEKWLEAGICDGVTTNPTIMYRDGVKDIEAETKKIAKLIHPRHLSVEVTTDDLNEMLKQARKFSDWADNIVIKIPVINQYGQNCLSVIKRLTEEKIKVNTTVIMSFGQFILATKAGTTYASIFAGRVGDEGGDAPTLIRRARQWLDLWDYKTEIIVGSIRTIIDIQEAAQAGTHIVTIPPDLLAKMVDHKYSRDTVRQFMEDVRKITL